MSDKMRSPSILKHKSLYKRQTASWKDTYRKVFIDPFNTTNVSVIVIFLAEPFDNVHFKAIAHGHVVLVLGLGNHMFQFYNFMRLCLLFACIIAFCFNIQHDPSSVLCGRDAR